MRPWYQKNYFRCLVDMHIPNGEGNLEDFDAEAYADNMQKAGVETAYVYASNCLGLCLYPSEIGYCHDITKKRDIFGETVAALRRRGIGVVGYLNSWSTECARQHPDWQVKMSNGYIKAEHGRFGTCCPNSPFREFFHALVYEMVSKYDIDGLWVDMIGFFAPDCVCDYCRDKYKKATGFDIPDKIDFQDENFLRYIDFKWDTVASYTEGITAMAKKAKPGISLSYQCASWHFSFAQSLGPRYFATMDYLSGDFYDNRSRTDIVCRLFHKLSNKLPFEYMISRAPDLTYHTALKNKNEILSQAYAALLCGGSFLFIDAIDPSGKLNPALYTEMGEVKTALLPFLSRLDVEDKIQREVGIYINFDSFSSPDANGKSVLTLTEHTLPIRNRLETLNTLLSKAHFDYDILTEKNINELSSYKLLIVPDLFRMKKSECAALAAYVKEGGRLYVSGVSSLLSTDGRNSDAFMLEEVLGVSFDKMADRRPIYIAPKEEVLPLFGCFNGDYPAMYTGKAPLVKLCGEEAKVLATVTLPFSDASDFTRYSSAISNPPAERTDIPALVYNRYGKGSCLYSVASFESSANDCDHVLLINLLSMLLEEAGGLTLTTKESEALELVMRHNPEKKYYTFSLLNYQDLRTPIPLRGVTFTLHKDVAPTRVYTVRGEEVSYERTEEGLVFTLDTLAHYDVIYLHYD